MQTLKIGILAPEFPPIIGGMHTYAVNLSRELQRRGHEIHIFARTGTNDSSEVEDLTVHRILTGDSWADRKILDTWDMDVWHAINSAYSIASLYKPRVFVSIHGKDFVNPWLHPHLRVKIFSTLKNFPYIWRFNWRAADALIERLVIKFLIHYGYRKAKKIFANSSYTAKRFNKKHPGNAKKINITYAGVEPSFFEVPRRSNGKKKRILTVSRLSCLSTLKNVDKIIIALGTLRNKYDFEYVIVGDGTLRIELEKLAKKCGIGDRVRFLGFISTVALREIYGSSDIFVLASSENEDDFEGFGIVYIEANAAGIPVLACRQGGAIDAVEEDISGMFVDTPSEDEIADKLEQFLSGELHFNESEIRQHARKFLWAKIVNEIELNYFKAINGQNSTTLSYKRLLKIS